MGDFSISTLEGTLEKMQGRLKSAQTKLADHDSIRATLEAEVNKYQLIVDDIAQGIKFLKEQENVTGKS